MKLYLIRHTTPHDVAPSDDARTLTAQGKEEARIVGTALGKMGVRPVRILTSPLVRARQTAEIIAQALVAECGIEPVEELKNGFSTVSLLRLLKRCGPDDEVLLVGHMPGLADHIGQLIGAGSNAGFGLGKGSVACIETLEPKAGSGQLRWLMHQNQLDQLIS